MQKLCAVVVALAVGASLGVAGTNVADAESAKIAYAMVGDMEAKGSYDFHTVAGIRDTTEVTGMNRWSVIFGGNTSLVNEGALRGVGLEEGGIHELRA